MEDSKFIMITSPLYQFVQRGIPKVADINKKVIYASKDLVKKYSNQIELINIENGYRIACSIRPKYDPTNRFKNKIFINRYHVLLLGLKKDIEQSLIITSLKENRLAPFQKVKTTIRQYKRSAMESIGNFFIGYRELELRVGHIYPFDENHKVARIHPNIRKFLAIQENERLILTYQDGIEKLPVLDLDTNHVNEAFKIDDEFVDSHLYIGIPATTRNQLNIPNIGTVIKVRRSMRFLLMKHINKLILPLIALWFAIINLIRGNSHIIWIILLIIILTPIIVFASLSEERSKVK